MDHVLSFHNYISEQEENNIYIIDRSETFEKGPRLDVTNVKVKHSGKTYNIGTLSMFNGRDRDTFNMKWNQDELRRLFPDMKWELRDHQVDSGTREADWWDPMEGLEHLIKAHGGVIQHNYK
jgi:hypothetical protein